MRLPWVTPPQVKKLLLSMRGETTRAELMIAVKIKDRKSFRKNNLYGQSNSTILHWEFCEIRIPPLIEQLIPTLIM